MSRITHHATAVTMSMEYEPNKKVFETIRNKAIELFGEHLVSEVLNSRINYYQTFFIAPDGSKDNWEISDKYDETRSKFLQYLESDKFKLEDGSSHIEYVVMNYGN